MVKELDKKSQTLYLCSTCGLGYTDFATAQKCEDHCNKYNSCSLEITRHAVLK